MNINSNNEYVVVFSDYYIKEKTEIVNFGFFSLNRGYEQETIDEIDGMAIGENLTVEHQTIYRTR